MDERRRWGGWAVAALALVWLASLATPAAAAELFSGRVVKVTDGDTLTVRHGDRDVSVRLEGVDAPESGQAFGKQATLRLRQLTRGQVVTVFYRAADRYGRPIAAVLLPDGRSLGRILVREGLAWRFEKYSDSLDLAALEALARRDKRGLWREPKPLAPWAFRRARAGRAEAKSSKASGEASKRASGPVHANTRSGIYHLPHCPSWSAVSDKNRKVFATAREAEAAGYRRAKNCKR